MTKLSLITVVIIVVLSSCGPNMCRDQYITPVFIGFELSDLDTIVVRQYEKGSNFHQLIDTALVTSDTTFLKSKATVNDTTFVLLNYISGREKYIFPDHDWQIYLPATNLTVSISNIVSPKTEGYSKPLVCTNPINSFIQDSIKTAPQFGKLPLTAGDYYLMYIKK